MGLLEKAKLALRVSTDAFDDEISDLIEAAKADLKTAGVILPNTEDPRITRAVITYCKAHFGEPDRTEWYDRLLAAYMTQKTQLAMSTGYTDWNAGAAETAAED